MSRLTPCHLCVNIDVLSWTCWCVRRLEMHYSSPFSIYIYHPVYFSQSWPLAWLCEQLFLCTALWEISVYQQPTPLQPLITVWFELIFILSPFKCKQAKHSIPPRISVCGFGTCCSRVWQKWEQLTVKVHKYCHETAKQTVNTTLTDSLYSSLGTAVFACQFVWWVNIKAYKG